MTIYAGARRYEIFIMHAYIIYCWRQYIPKFYIYKTIISVYTERGREREKEKEKVFCIFVKLKRLYLYIQREEERERERERESVLYFC